MAINFPDSPTTGDTYTSNGRTWQWDGSVWAAYGNYPDPTVLKVDTANSRVGVNNDTPTATLDVGGAAAISGGLTVGGDFTVSGTTTTINTTNLNVEDNIVTLNYGVTGTPSLDAGIEVERGDLANTSITWDESAESWVVGGTAYVDTANTRFGVGTASPDVPLHVDGDAGNHEIAKFQSSQTAATYSLVGITDANETAIGFVGFNPGASLNNTDSYLMLGMNGDDVNGGAGLIVKKGGNVGIGTTSPSSILELSAPSSVLSITDSDGTVGGSMSAMVYYKDSAGNVQGQIGYGTGVGYMVVDNLDGAMRVGTRSADALSLTTDSATRLIIDATGNIGINDSSPSYTLDVNGTLAINGTSQIFSNWSSGSDIDGLLPGSTFGGVMYTNTSGHFVFGIRDNDGTDSVSIVSGGGNWATDSTFDTMIATFQANGRVGIGSTSTQEKLDVFGNIRIENTNSGGEGAALRIENKGTAANTRAGIYFGVDSGSASPNDTGNAEIICINSGTSNMGILQFRVYDGADNEALKITGNGSNYTPAGGGGSNLANGVAFANAGIAIDKGWASYPGIHVFHTTGYGNTNQSEFRVHGWNTSYASYPARTGSDFSVNFRIDGATYFSSDRRHKTNIIDNPHGLSTILQLQPRKFDRINSDGIVEENNTDILGFIAQEVIEVLPEAVKYYPDEDVPNENGWCRAYSLSDSYIVSTLVNAVKELSAQNNDLIARIEALEAN